MDTTGTPAANASSTTFGIPSVYDGSASRSKKGKKRSRSARKPPSANAPARPAALICRASLSRQAPSPKTTKPTDGSFFTTRPRRFDQHVEALFRTKPAGRADDSSGNALETAEQFDPIESVEVVKAFGIDGVVNHAHAVAANAGSPGLSRLRLGDADHLIHPAQVKAVDRLVHADATVLAGPAARHAYHWNADAPRRQAT